MKTSPPATPEEQVRGSQSGAAGVAALERGLTVLLAFAGSDGPLRLADLAARTGLYKSAILRLCASLERLGFITRTGNGLYQLGGAVFQLGRVYQRSFRLGDLVIPVLQELAAASGESASLYVREGDQHVCLHRVSSPNPIRDAGVREGDRFTVLEESALARVLRAFSGDDSRSLDAVRRELFAVTSGTRAPNTAAAARPIFGHDQHLVGALSLSGPKSRFTDEAVANMKALLADAARRLTRNLGGNPGVYDSQA